MVHAALEEEIRTLRDRFWSERDPSGRVFAPLADAHRRAGELDEAMQLAEDGVERLPEFAPGHLVAARILRDRGAGDEAAAAYERVLELDPENLEALREGAALAQAEGRVGDALELCQKLARIEPKDRELRERIRALKRSHFDVEARDEEPADAAEAAGRAAEEIGPAVGRAGPAAGDAEPAVEDAGEDPPGVHGSTGSALEAEENEVYTRTMAELYARQGHVSRAIDVYRRLVADDPEDEGLRKRLEELESSSEGPGGATSPTPGAAEPGAGAVDEERSIASYFDRMLEWTPPGDRQTGGVIPVEQLAPDGESGAGRDAR